jgi:hypothetical protein
MATNELQERLAEFTRFARTLKGDEKSEAQLFLDHFFRALGHGGVQSSAPTRFSPNGRKRTQSSATRRISARSCSSRNTARIT